MVRPPAGSPPLRTPGLRQELRIEARIRRSIDRPPQVVRFAVDERPPYASAAVEVDLVARPGRDPPFNMQKIHFKQVLPAPLLSRMAWLPCRRSNAAPVTCVRLSKSSLTPGVAWLRRANSARSGQKAAFGAE